jgi:hypothetical protein
LQNQSKSIQATPVAVDTGSIVGGACVPATDGACRTAGYPGRMTGKLDHAD